ncbi:MAG: ribosomal protein [Candidatus Parcubacteria bacterium]|jgi:large subunit ribosomal protein L15
MITLHSLKPARGSKTKTFRVGRGNASGRGTTAGRGTKGQRARTGGRNKLKLKGIRMTLLRIPKNRGFKSGMPHAHAVTLSQLNRWCAVGERVTVDTLKKANRIPANAIGVKVLATGELTKALVLQGFSASGTARTAVEKAGGTFEAAPARVSVVPKGKKPSVKKPSRRVSA